MTYRSSPNVYSIRVCSLFYPFFLYTTINKNWFTSYFYKWRHDNAMRGVFLDTQINKKIIYSNTNILSTKRVSNKSILERFLTFLLKNGLKIRYCNILSRGISRLYFMFFFFDKLTAGDNRFYKDMFTAIPNFLYFFSFKTILTFFTSLLEPFFYVRVKKVEKKYRKKLKKKFTIQPMYVKPAKRTSFVLRVLITYTNLFSSYSLSERLFLSIFKTLTEQRDSFLYRRKLYMYTKLFLNNQKKVF